MANEPLNSAVVTDVGKVKLDAAYQAGEKIVITQMALGDSNLTYAVPDPTFTSLVNEFGRQDINEGNTTDSWINAIVYVDSSRFAGKSILEFGLYDADGDLIVYSSYTPSVIPAIDPNYIQLEIECSVDLYNASAVTLEVNPIYPQATELERGIAKTATDTDVTEGVDDEKMITSKKLRSNHATKEEAETLGSSKKLMSPLRWLQAFKSRLSNVFDGTREDYAVSEKALSAGLADAIAQLHATGWGAKSAVTILDFDSNPLEWNDGKSTLFRASAATENLPVEGVGGVGMVIRYADSSSSHCYLEFRSWQGITYSKYWNGAQAVWSELAEHVTSSSFDTYLNQYGLGGPSPAAKDVGYLTFNFNDITGETRNLSVGGTWYATPLGDGVAIGGQLTVLRRNSNSGAAIVQLLQCHDGYQYRRVGTGDEESRSWSEWQKILTDADFELTSTYQHLPSGFSIQYFQVAYSTAGHFQSFTLPYGFENRCVGWFALPLASEPDDYATVIQSSEWEDRAATIEMSANKSGIYLIVAFGY